MTKSVCFVLLLIMSAVAEAVGSEEQQATVAVVGYDVGAAALAKQPGVIAVEKGWQGPKEINRVFYDPGQIGIEQLEKTPKEAGTYRATLSLKSSRKDEGAAQ